jgi:hypothetical protein
MTGQPEQAALAAAVAETVWRFIAEHPDTSPQTQLEALNDVYSEIQEANLTEEAKRHRRASDAATFHRPQPSAHQVPLL